MQSAIRNPQSQIAALTTRRAPRSQSATLNTQHSTRQSGIALVITLILLSVTLVMAIAFLAISNRERNSVTTVMDTKVAQDASAAALAQAEAQIIAQILVTTNPYISSLLVSTNYINAAGFTNGVQSLANVNYDHYVNISLGLNSQDYLRNISDLFYSPRAPVFVTLPNGSNDFRFYLDLNRNGKYDTNGVNFYTENIDNNNNDMGSQSREVGDPEWIGILEHPDQPHSANNPFIARFCFMAVPADSLDLNYIHNQALNEAKDPPAGDAYNRNQGVATWEINLAAFLTDLNTNRWDPPTIWNNLQEPYQYPELLQGNSVAFDDARHLVQWRYDNNYDWLATADNMFALPSLGDSAFRYNGIDYYTVGQAQTMFDTNYAGSDDPTLPWVGADNYTNQFFSSPSDLFDPGKSSTQFTNNLISAGDYNSTYDRYTFYRMLSQIGTDSQGESDKINLNYSNTLVSYDFNGIPTNITVIPNAETNFVPWTPINFFTAAVDKMLHAYSAEWYQSSPSNYVQTYYGTTLSCLTNGIYNVSGWGLTNIQYFGQTNQIPSFGITNIPVVVNGQFVYTPAVNRILQLAANIYDATTNSADNPNVLNNYPSVFRPILWKTNELNAFGVLQTNIYIRGYQYVSEPVQIVNGYNAIFNRPTELTDPTVPNGIMGITNNFYGVPWIIGAKKGFPNFNAFELDNTFFIERFLQFNRSTISASGSTYPYGRTYTTNQMYFIGISNVFGVEHWNSYLSNYLNPVTVVAQDVLDVGLTNDANMTVVNESITNGYAITGPWTAGAFVMPLGTNVFIPQNLAPPGTVPATNNLYVYFDGSAYGSTNIGGNQYNAPCFIPVTSIQVPPTPSSPGNYINTGTPALPQFGLSTTNRLQAYILDTHISQNSVYILDYVQLGSMNNALNINQAISDPDDSGYWSTNIVGGDTPYGVWAQYQASYNGGTVPGADNDGPTWQNTYIPGVGPNAGQAAQQAYFTAFFQQNNVASDGAGYVTNNLLSTQAPAMAMRKIVEKFAYQANDPLVHYVTSDLNDSYDDTTNKVALSLPSTNGLQYLGKKSDRYMPWGVSGKSWPSGQAGYDSNPYNLSYRDPLVWTADNWDFPTNKFPTVGWLGRVHRGTPWQTVYLKSTNLMNLTTVINNGPTVSAGLPTWQLWTGNANADDAYNTAPIQDRLLFDLFTTAPNNNATRGQLSVNVGAEDPNNPLAALAAWSALLSGTTVFSNSLIHQMMIQSYAGYESPLWNQRQPTYTNLISQPMGTITNSPMWQIVQSINSARTNFVGVDGLHGVFEHVGDILSANALSDASPYLNQLYNGGVDQNQQDYGISDEMYEWIPQQIMSLLTVSGTPQSPPRYVIYCYGQSLKPAPNGVVNSAGPFFGLVTNYQVTAESAYRAVIRVENSPTPANPNTAPHIVIEQFNPLPPD